MSRPVGFLWSYPGFPSIVVAYFDTNDFFFSGHVGNCTMMLIEMWALGEKKVAFLILFILLNEWTMLMLVRTHYIIDFVTGLIFALVLHRIAEKVCFIYDVKVAGLEI
jgi:PAP2 superfamily C-terminal